jgi:hypothetical protein
LGRAPETSASPPVLAKGTASEVRMAMRIRNGHKEAHKAQNAFSFVPFVLLCG